jgi:hypothetical protein
MVIIYLKILPNIGLEEKIKTAKTSVKTVGFWADSNVGPPKYEA